MPDKNNSSNHNENANGNSNNSHDSGSSQDSSSSQSAAITQISLSQALLAPLDAIFKAQIHSARSFVNLILQLGYHHNSVDDKGNVSKDEGKPYYLEFIHETEENGIPKKQKISVPALAAVPISPLAVESAEFDFSMNIESTAKHSQVQKSRDEGLNDVNRNRRPWFLVDQPISVRGTLAPGEQSTRSGEIKSNSAIHISVKVGPAKVPAGLNRFLTSLSELSSISDVTPPKTEPDMKNNEN